MSQYRAKLGVLVGQSVHTVTTECIEEIAEYAQRYKELYVAFRILKDVSNDRK